MDKVADILAKIKGLFSKNVRYEEFELPNKEGEEREFAGDGGYGTPESLPSPERPPLRHIDKYIRPECPCLTKRYTVATLTCVGFIISFGMRCNMGMAKLGFNNNNSKFHLNWTVATESAVDSSFFWGYLITQVPGGFLASMYPANRIFGTAIACSSFLNLLVPGAIELHPTAVICVRILQGLVEGVTYPACHGIWRFWAPPLERSRLATLAFSGSYAGVVIGMPMSGILTSNFGWQAAFYFYGVVGMIWFMFWLWLVFEKPANHPTITARELMYIEQSLGSSVQAAMPTIATTPWKYIFTSMPVYAIIVANFCRSWNFYLLVLFQASYLQGSFNLKIEETGFIGALPHLIMTLIVPFGGLLADHIRKKGILSTTNVRKVFNCGGFGMEGLFFLVVAYARSASVATVALTIGVAYSGFAISGFNVNHLDIAPRYASILMGLSNGIGTIAGLICPIAIDNIVKNHHDRDRWTVVYIIAACVHFCGITFYGIFASGDLQPWAEPSLAEQKAWNPFEESYKGEPRKSVPQTEHQGDQSQLNPKESVNYGAVEHVAGNPFAYANHVTEETIQPEPHDPYLHGTVEDRTY